MACILLPLATSSAHAGESPWEKSYALAKQKQYEKAASVIQGFTRKQQTAEFAWLRIGWLRYRAGHYDGALSAYQHALAINPNSLDALLGETLPLLAQKRYRAAARQASLALDQSPGNYTAETRLAYCQWVLGQWENLEQLARGMTRQFPSESGGWIYLARAKAHQGDTNAARYDYQQVLMRWPGNQEALKGIQ